MGAGEWRTTRSLPDMGLRHSDSGRGAAAGAGWQQMLRPGNRCVAEYATRTRRGLEKREIRMPRRTGAGTVPASSHTLFIGLTRMRHGRFVSSGRQARDGGPGRRQADRPPVAGWLALSELGGWRQGESKKTLQQTKESKQWICGGSRLRGLRSTRPGSSSCAPRPSRVSGGRLRDVDKSGPRANPGPARDATPPAAASSRRPRAPVAGRAPQSILRRVLDVDVGRHAVVLHRRVAVLCGESAVPGACSCEDAAPTSDP